MASVSEDGSAMIWKATGSINPKERGLETVMDGLARCCSTIRLEDQPDGSCAPVAAAVINSTKIEVSLKNVCFVDICWKSGSEIRRQPTKCLPDA